MNVYDIQGEVGYHVALSFIHTYIIGTVQSSPGSVIPCEATGRSLFENCVSTR